MTPRKAAAKKTSRAQRARKTEAVRSQRAKTAAPEKTPEKATRSRTRRATPEPSPVETPAPAREPRTGREKTIAEVGVARAENEGRRAHDPKAPHDAG